MTIKDPAQTPPAADFTDLEKQDSSSEGRIVIPQDTWNGEVVSLENPPLPVQNDSKSLIPSASSTGRFPPFVQLLVVLLSFFLASFPARNSDLFVHLVSGRQLSQGDFGNSPQSSAASASSVSHGWLYDIISYGLYTAAGGSGLVLAKALLIAALAFGLLRICHTGSGWLAPVFCTTLAILALSTRVLLQPATVSYFLLAVTIWLLQNDSKKKSLSTFRIVPPWQLLLLFVVWANMDAGFVVGLAIVALYLLGQVLDSRSSILRESPQTLGSEASASPLDSATENYNLTNRFRELLNCAIFLALLAGACLLNPYLIRNPTMLDNYFLPQEIARLSTLGGTASSHLFSPFQRAYFANVGFNPAGLAFFPMLGLGLLTFILNRSHWRWQWFLPWLATALWACFQARSIPFFAVVSAPVLAWNLQEIFNRFFNNQQLEVLGWRRLVAMGPFMTVIGVLALLACAWPGWLQTPPFEPRRWEIDMPPSLKEGALATRLWHQDGKLRPDDRGFHLSPETAGAFAWFCPEEQGVVDQQLTSELLAGQQAASKSAQVMRSAGINHIILYNSDRGRLLEAMAHFLDQPEQWPLLYIEGDLAVFGWRDPIAVGNMDSLRDWQMDLNTLAFHPSEAKWAPSKAPDREPEAREWWEAYWKPSPAHPLGRDQATFHLFHSEVLRQLAPQKHFLIWEASQTGSLFAALPGWTGLGALFNANMHLTLIQPQVADQGKAFDSLPSLDRLAYVWQKSFTVSRDDIPPATLYLAIRSARRAVDANPDDAQAYLVLGEAYLRLQKSTRERVWSERMPELLQLRRAQASAALNQAIALKPDFAQAHLDLAGLYQDLGYLDLTLQHLQIYQELVQKSLSASRAGSEPASSPIDPDKIDKLIKDVQNRNNTHTVESANSKMLARAMLAARLGLAGKARDLLLDSDISAFGPQGMALELGLLIATGRPRKVVEWIGPEQMASLGASRFHWLRVQAFAALGDYALAQDECAEMARLIRGGDTEANSIRIREGLAFALGKALLDEVPMGQSIVSTVLHYMNRFQFQRNTQEVAVSFKQSADAMVIAGLLALEQGDAGQAEFMFQLALTIWKDDATTASGGGLDFNGRPVAQAGLGWLAEAPHN